MTGFRHRFLAAIGLASAIALGGCAYDDGYGYSGVNVGAGYYGGGGYYDPYYGPAGYSSGLYNGWYDGFYYPGRGYYVYDRGGRRQRWSDAQRRYWEARRDDRWGNGRPGGWNGDRNGWRGDRDGRWRGRDRDGRDRDGRPGNWTRPTPPANGGVTTPGTINPDRGGWRGGWRGRDGVRPTPQPGLRAPQAGQPQVRPDRPQRSWGSRPSPGMRMDRPGRSGGGRDFSAPRTRPD